MKNILLVDDEQRMLDLLGLYLEGDIYHCEKEISGVQAIKRVAKGNFDLILLDVMMPDLDGWTVCKNIREFSEIPIIMLTARGQNTDVSFGLKNGADDYITKPFDETILLARIENLSLDKERFQIWINQKLLEVTPIEFNLLDMFLTHQNHVFSREQIIEHIWGLTADVDNRTVDSHIRNLREKMRKESFDVDSFLLTVYGVGYKWQK